MLDAAGILVFHHFSAAPLLLNSAGNGRIDRDRVSLDIDDNAVPVNVERRVPSILRVLFPVHPHLVNPVLVSDSPDDDGIAGLEGLGGRYRDLARTNRHVVGRNGLLCVVQRCPTGGAPDVNQSARTAEATAPPPRPPGAPGAPPRPA